MDTSYRGGSTRMNRSRCRREPALPWHDVRVALLTFVHFLVFLPLTHHVFAETQDAVPVKALVRRLTDVDRGVRYAAAEALGRIGPAARSAGSDLVILRGDLEWCVRAAAIRALGQIGGMGAIELESGLAQRPAEEQVMVLRALAWAPEARNTIERYARSSDPRVSDAALRILEAPLTGPAEARSDRSGHPRPSVGMRVPAEILALSDPWLARQFEARRNLVAAGAAASIPLAATMANGRYDVLWHGEEIFRSLGASGAPAVPRLASLLEHVDENVREVAGSLLGELGAASARAVPALLETLEDPRIAVRGKAMMALGRIGRDAPVDAIVNPIRRALDHEDARVRAGAAFALGVVFSRFPVPAYDPRLPLAEPGRAEQTGHVPAARHLRLAARVGVDLEIDLDTLSSSERAEALAILRAGLRSSDPRVATSCAARLRMTDMDAWEAERAVELLLPTCFADDSEFRFGDLYDYLGSSEVAATIGYFVISGMPIGAVVEVAGMCHRIVRPDLLPFLRDLKRTPDAWILTCDEGSFSLPRRYSDRHRERVPWRGKGLSPVLRAALATRNDLGDWRRAWLLDSTPADSDSDLLVGLLSRLASEDAEQVGFDRDAVLLSLRWLSDTASERALRERLEHDSALAALAGRGDARASMRLEKKAAVDVEVLALLATVLPERARVMILNQLMGSDPDAPCFELGEVRPSTFHGAKVSGPVWRDLTEPFLRSVPATQRLLRAALRIPGMRNQTMARALFQRLETEGPACLLGEHKEDGLAGYHTREGLAFLDGADRDRLLSCLRRWMSTGGPLEQRFAVQALIHMGDSASEPALLRWLASHPEEGDESVPFWHPARGSCPALDAYLKRRSFEFRAADFAFPWTDPRGITAWLLTLLSGGVAQRLVAWGIPVAAIAQEFRDESGEGYDMTPFEPPRDPPSEWITFLEGLREKPHLVSVPALLGQLAALGNSRARREFWSAIRAGRYRWICYENEPVALTLGWDRQTLPYWLHELEGNCCRGGHIARMFEDLMGEEFGFKSHGVDGTPARNVRRWIQLHGGRFVPSSFSDVGTVLVPAVRD